MAKRTENLYHLETTDIPKAVEVLFDAFQHDSVFNAIFEGAAPEQFKAMYEAPLRYCLHYGQVCAPSQSMQGVAGWVSGRHAEMTPWRMLRSGALWPGLRMGQHYSRRMMQAFRPIDAGRKKHMGHQPYLYLFFIGAASQHQGQGWGRVLLDEVIRIAEQDRLPVYLETETEKNVRLYQHFGFEVIQKVSLPVIDLPMWEMLRKPT